MPKTSGSSDNWFQFPWHRPLVQKLYLNMLHYDQKTLSGCKNNEAGKEYKTQSEAVQAVVSNGFFHG